MTDQSKKTIGITAVAVIIVAIVAFAIFHKSNNAGSKSPVAGDAVDKTTLNDIVPQNGEASSTTSTPASVTNGGTGGTKISASERYQQALAKYPYRIVFSGGCKASVGTAVNGTLMVKKGASIMLDNQDDATRTISYQGHSYKVSPHDFVVGTVTAIGTYPVMCNGITAAEFRVEP